MAWSRALLLSLQPTNVLDQDHNSHVIYFMSSWLLPKFVGIFPCLSFDHVSDSILLWRRLVEHSIRLLVQEGTSASFHLLPYSLIFFHTVVRPGPLTSRYHTKPTALPFLSLTPSVLNLSQLHQGSHEVPLHHRPNLRAMSLGRATKSNRRRPHR